MNKMKSQLQALCIAVLAVVFLSACESNSASTTNIETNERLIKDAQGRLVADPIAQFVVNTPPGNFGTILTEQNETIRIRVGRDYISAANKRCRNMIVQYPNGIDQMNAVCLDGQIWKTVLNKY